MTVSPFLQRLGAPGWRGSSARAVRALALLLLAWQAVLTQSHFHATGEPIGGAPTIAASSATQLAAPQHRRDGPADCPICREIAHAGQYLSPAPLLVALPGAITAWLAPAALPVTVRRPRSHFWRSRAPPVSLLS